MEVVTLRLKDISVRSSQHVCLACRTFSSSSLRSATKQHSRRFRDPYAAAQARARKAANESRQAQLQKERSDALGDPVRGAPTPYVESLDTAMAPPPSAMRSQKIPLVEPEGAVKASTRVTGGRPTIDLNFFLDKDELESSLSRSKIWSGSRVQDQKDALYNNIANFRLPGMDDGLDPGFDPAELRAQQKEATHQTASEAIRRITSLGNSSSKDRLRVNIKRCISTFGRHNTEQTLPPKPAPSAAFLAEQAANNNGKLPPAKTPRAGPDTGSSEVQIAVLTARIRTLSQFLETRGKPDKMNKRNLRLLVHKRQKLLRYLERKERGGPRFQNVVEVLGLTPGAWKGEITLR